MESNDIVDLVLFIGRKHKPSQECKVLLQSRKVPFRMVHIDHSDVRDRLHRNSSFSIIYVPTLLLVYSDDTATKLEGLETITSWVNTYYSESVMTDNVLPEDDKFLTPPLPPRRNPNDVEDFEMLDNRQFGHEYFDDDIVFEKPEPLDQKLGNTQNPYPGMKHHVTHSVLGLAEQMRQESGLDC